MSTFLFDLRHGLRMLRRSPGVTVAAVAALALGIGVNVTVFAFLQALLLGPVPFSEPERVVYLWSTDREAGRERLDVSLADFRLWHEASRGFTALAAFDSRSTTLAGNPPERLQGVAVSAGFFTVAGAQAEVGRTFLPSDEAASSPPVVLSHDLWQRRFGADPAIAGRTVTLDRKPTTVVGVMPAGFWFPSPQVQLWTLLDLAAAGNGGEGGGTATVVGLLAPGATVEAARTEMTALARRLEEAYPATHAGRGVRVVPISLELLGPSDRMALILLALASVSVLLVACFNVANLLTARVAARRWELGVRTALGASRRRLVRQLLTEVLPLALLGGAVALLLAAWGARLLLALFPGSTPPPETLVDLRVVGFSLVLTLLTTLISGLLPALRSSRPAVTDALQEGGSASGRGRHGRRLSRILVVAQVTLALALLLVVGLLMRTLTGLYRMDPGFRTGEILTLRIDPPGDAPAGWVDFAGLLTERLEALPEVLSAAVVNQPPFAGGGRGVPLILEGQETAGSPPRALSVIVGPDYFETLGIPILHGRGFTPEDRAGAVPVVIVNAALARRYWGDRDPLGSRLRLAGQNGTEEDETGWWTVAGVAGDVRRVHPAFAPSPQVYFPYAQRPVASLALVARTRGEPLDSVDAVRTEVARLDAHQPVYEIEPLSQRLADLLAVPWAFADLLGLFGALALVLAAVGVYGVVAHAVSQRDHEIGVRLALGASVRSIERLLFREGLKLVSLGVLAGLVLAFALSRLMANRFTGMETAGPIFFLAVTALLAAVALLASWLPARRAGRVEPVETLRRT